MRQIVKGSIGQAQRALDKIPFADLSAWIAENLHKPVPVELLAERMAMSPYFRLDQRPNSNRSPVCSWC